MWSWLLCSNFQRWHACKQTQVRVTFKKEASNTVKACRDQEILSIEDARLCQLLITQITLYLEFNEGKLDEASEPALQFLDRKMDAVYNRYLSDKNVPFEASLEHRISAYQIVLADYLPKSHGHIRFRLPKRQDWFKAWILKSQKPKMQNENPTFRNFSRHTPQPHPHRRCMYSCL